MPEISILVPTHNRAAFLEKCVESLVAQTVAPDRFEICVIASACSDDTPATVNRLAARHPRHRIFLVAESQPGASRARNRGLATTTGDLVASIDDDGTVYPDWIARVVARFAEFGPTLAIVAGEIEPVWGTPRPAWVTPKMLPPMSARSDMAEAACFMKPSDWIMEGNCCFRRAALLAVDGFPEGLGRAAGNLASGEGNVKAQIERNGGRAFFDPAIILRHYIHPDRLQPLWLRRRQFWEGVSSVAVRKYKARLGLPVDPAVSLRLPLDRRDWVFVGQDTADDLENSMDRMHDLGFALALAGIIPAEG